MMSKNKRNQVARETVEEAALPAVPMRILENLQVMAEDAVWEWLLTEGNAPDDVRHLARQKFELENVIRVRKSGEISSSLNEAIEYQLALTIRRLMAVGVEVQIDDGSGEMIAK